jgi:cell division protein FtsL
MSLRGRTRIRVPSSRGGALALIVIGLLIAVSAAIAQVWTQQQVIEHGYKISEQTRRRARLLEINRRLRIELAVLKDPERIARLAKQRLGMRAPEPEQIRRLRKPRNEARKSKRGETPSLFFSTTTAVFSNQQGGNKPR